MTTIATSLAGGFVLGFAGSFHCACMCGSIASGALFILNPRTYAERISSLFLLQGGRIATYAIAGAAMAGIAELTLGPGTTALTFRLLQWLSAAVLMWAGLSMAGLVPAIALPQTLGGLTTLSNRALASVRNYPTVAPVSAGMVWGMTPCPMVYAALIPAMLTGSPAAGATWMLGFGLGTLPAVVGAALGVSALRDIRNSKFAQVIAGLAVAVFGLFSATRAFPELAALCGLR
jgi:uncharacterized protein